MPRNDKNNLKIFIFKVSYSFNMEANSSGRVEDLTGILTTCHISKIECFAKTVNGH